MVEFENHQIRIGETLNSQRFEIINAESQVVNLQLRSPMRLPFGEISERPSEVLSLDLLINGNTVRGQGEGATLPKPIFSDDYGDIIGHATIEIVNTLKANPIGFSDAVEKIQQHRFKNGENHPTARMTVEMAIIDAVAKSLDKSVADILGIPDEMLEVPYGKSIGGGSVKDVVNEAEDAVRLNAKKIKLKITPESAEIVIHALDAIRRNHSDLELMVDANGTFDPTNSDHLSIIEAIDSQELTMFEEPVSRVGQVRGLDAVRLLRKAIPNLKTPICLDDCLTNIDLSTLALDENLADIINIKPGRIGSIMRAIDLAYLCKKKGKQIMVGGMLEATPGRMMTTTLAAYFYTLGFHVPGDLSLAQERLSQDLVTDDQQLKIGPQGGIIIPRSKGWGFEL